LIRLPGLPVTFLNLPTVAGGNIELTRIVALDASKATGKSDFCKVRCSHLVRIF